LFISLSRINMNQINSFQISHVAAHFSFTTQVKNARPSTAAFNRISPFWHRLYYGCISSCRKRSNTRFSALFSPFLIVYDMSTNGRNTVDAKRVKYGQFTTVTLWLTAVYAPFTVIVMLDLSRSQELNPFAARSNTSCKWFLCYFLKTFLVRKTF
jgi:hypothetical protein